MHITTVGDVMLDVLVDVPTGLRTDDDTEATITLCAGGQAANVAAWAAALGANATLIGPRGASAAAVLVGERLEAAGVVYKGVAVEGLGTVVSILTGGMRTLASDAGDQSWISRVTSTDVPPGTDWLHLSAYPLLRTSDHSAVDHLVSRARGQAVRVSVDLSSSSSIEAYGPERFRRRLDALEPDLVFANQAEWGSLGSTPGPTWPNVVLKLGPAGATVVSAGVAKTSAAPDVTVMDTTGAGDAFAAGYLLGGLELGLEAAARCVAQRGAQPVMSG